MAFSDAAKNAMLDALDEGGSLPGAFISLHTADPGTTGASEVAGGSPAYTREAAVWGAAASGAKDLTSTPQFDVPASTTVTHYGVWTLVSGGSFIGGGALSASEVFSGQGTYTLSDADLNLT